MWKWEGRLWEINPGLVLHHLVILAAFDVEHQLCESPCGKPLEKLLGLVWPEVDGQTLVSWSAVVSHPLTPGQPR